MTVCGNPLSRSLSGVKRTCLVAAHMSAFDPKRTWVVRSATVLEGFSGAGLSRYSVLVLGGAMRRREFTRFPAGPMAVRLNASIISDVLIAVRRGDDEHEDDLGSYGKP
jgi:hypothetical protein